MFLLFLLSIAREQLPPLLPFWEERRDPSTGKLYYINHETRLTSWDRPVAPSAPLPVSPSAASVSVPITASIQSITMSPNVDTDTDTVPDAGAATTTSEEVVCEQEQEQGLMQTRCAQTPVQEDEEMPGAIVSAPLVSTPAPG